MADERLEASVFQGLHDSFTVAFENEDNDALARLYAPTAVMIGPAGQVLAGRDAIMAFLQRAQRIQSVRFEPSDTRQIGDGAVRQVGALTLTVRGQGRETRSLAGSFLVLWAKRGDDWQMDACVWTRQPQNQGGRAGGRGMGGGGRGMGGGGGMGGGRGMGGGGMGGGRGMSGGGRGMGGRAGRGGDVEGSSDGGEGGAVVPRGRQGGRTGGAFNPRNLHRDDDAPLIPRLE